MESSEQGAVVQPITEMIPVALDRVWQCPDGVPDLFSLAWQVQDKKDNLPQTPVDSDT